MRLCKTGGTALSLLRLRRPMCGKAVPFRESFRFLSGLRPLFRFVPVDLIKINFQRFIFRFAMLPIPCARPSIINCSFNQSGSHRIQVDVVHLLHKDTFAENLKDVCLVLPERVAVISFPVFVPQLFERAFVALLLQMLDHAMSDCAFDVAQNFRGLVA